MAEKTWEQLHDELAEQLAAANAEIERLRAALEEVLKADRSRAKFENYGTCGQIAKAALTEQKPGGWFDAKAWHEK